MKCVAIIQARMGSSRLPGKVLLPLPGGMNVLESVISRVKQISGLNEIVVAIPDTRIDSLLIPVVRNSSVNLAIGSELDVLARYWRAANESKADVIMRITADCPLLNPRVCSDMLAEFMGREWDYLSNALPRTFPKGWDCEVFSRELLEMTHKLAATAYDREHVTPWMHSGWKRSTISVGCHTDATDNSEVNFCIDTLEDYYRICVEIVNRDKRRRERLQHAGTGS